ncbi:MAG: exopolysaccharide biosynthesis polyprenyl glycosylphosphotransferase [Planctomycetota bacterium]|nr:exopolysaccharide biosynthesis polyprenyl glycosylphosphotransferase [Planctomycetota bacterium]
MRGRHSLPTMIPLFILDALWASIAWLSAFSLRFFTTLFDTILGPAQFPVPLNIYLGAIPVIIAVSFASQYWLGYYTVEGPVKRSDVSSRIRGAFTTLALLLALSALYRDASYSRLVGLIFFLLLSPGPQLSWLLLKPLLRRIWSRNSARRGVLIVGQGPLALAFAEQVKERPWLGLELTGALRFKDEAVTKESLLPDLGTLEQLESCCLEKRIKEVFVALPLEDAKSWGDIERRLRALAVDFHIVIDGRGFLSIRPQTTRFGALPILTVRESPRYGWNRLGKRIFDLVFGLMALLVSLPVMVLIALTIKLSSKGPIFYVQQRVGWAGGCFPMIKFRTMNVEAEAGGPQFAVKDDPRRTTIGTILRVLSLDELPQLWNVLRGEMSLVGPRPERPEFLGDIAERIPHFPLRQSVKAGMTGLAQINGQRGQAPLEDRLRFDLDYVQNWSLWLDLRILIVTMFGGFLSRNAI